MYVLPVLAAIFNLPLTLLSESVHTSSAVWLDSENVAVAYGICGYLVWKLISCVLSYVLPVMAAIFYLPLTLMSESVPIILAVLLEPDIVGVAFGIPLLVCLKAEILRYFPSTSG